MVRRQRAQNRKEVLRTKQETRKKTRSPRDAKVTEGKPEEKDERTGQMTEENRFKHFFFPAKSWLVALHMPANLSLTDLECLP